MLHNVLINIQNLFNRIYQYRNFITDNVYRNFQLRYQSSLLGAIWVILQPAAIIFIYTLVFSTLMHNRMINAGTRFAYSIYLCSGILPWNFFTEILNNLVNVFLKNANIIKKVNFPRICLPIIVSLSSLINFLIIFTIFMLFMIFSSNFPGWIIFAVIPVLIIQMIFTISLGVVLGIINVFVRDVEHFINILVQFWFWFTPIVYSINTLPQWAYAAMYFNPMAILINSYQNILLYKCMPNWLLLSSVIIVSLLLFIVDWHTFKRCATDMMDEI